MQVGIQLLKSTSLLVYYRLLLLRLARAPGALLCPPRNNIIKNKIIRKTCQKEESYDVEE
jgi:hypothetical protein